MASYLLDPADSSILTTEAGENLIWELSPNETRSHPLGQICMSLLLLLLLVL